MTKIHTIFTFDVSEDGFDGALGADEEGNLYWDQKQIVTKQNIELQW